MSDFFTYTVPEQTPPTRADKVLAAHLTELSRTAVQAIFDSQNVSLNNQPISRKQKIYPGDTLEVTLPQPKSLEVTPVDIPLDILFEDEDILIVNKHSGLVVHPGSATADDTLAHAALHHTAGKLSHLGGSERPGIVHRLDKETSGAIILAKSDAAYLNLIEAFSQRTIQKEYIALTAKAPELDSGSIKNNIGRNPIHRTKMSVIANGRPAHTDWQVEHRYTQAAQIRCYLHTGRTHQIRVHMAHIGHPLLGDTTYGYRPQEDRLPEVPRIMLHAQKLKFTHPTQGSKVDIEAPLPADFLEYRALISQ